VRAARARSMPPIIVSLIPVTDPIVCAAARDATLKPHYIDAEMRKSALAVVKKAEAKVYKFTEHVYADASAVRRRAAYIWSNVVRVRQHLIFSFTGKPYPCWSHGVEQAKFLSDLDLAHTSLAKFLDDQKLLVQQSTTESLVFGTADDRDAELLLVLSLFLLIYFEFGTLYTEVRRLRARGADLDRDRAHAVRARAPLERIARTHTRTH
jgi:hypothetical protein